MAEEKKKKKKRGRPKKDGRGRPKLEIDLALVKQLGEIQCTLDEVATVLNLHKGTLSHRQDVLDAWNAGREVGKMSLRRLQFSLAERNPAMAIWLGKQYLEQKDKQEVDSKVENSIVFKEEKTYITPKEEDEDKLN